MIKWNKVSDKLPKNGLYCLLYAENGSVHGPIMWSEKAGGWLDLFATPEAGTFIKPDTNGLTHWAKFNGPDDGKETK